MTKTQKKLEIFLQELVGLAERQDIEVRIEKLAREVGYHPRSGRCRVGEKDVIIVDKDAPIGDKVEFLAQELRHQDFDGEILSPEIRGLLEKP